MTRDIKNYEGLYAITDDGRIWSYISRRFITGSVNNKGYVRVDLYKEGKRKSFAIHRLVLETFKPVEGMEKLQANHIDENKLNNNLSNLEWTTPRENTLYSSYKWKDKKKGSVKPVAQYDLDGKLIATYKSQSEAARQTGINRYCISNVFRGHRHTAGGYYWRYVDGKEKKQKNISC